jgi:multidrug resistance efflux pump
MKLLEREETTDEARLALAPRPDRSVLADVLNGFELAKERRSLPVRALDFVLGAILVAAISFALWSSASQGELRNASRKFETVLPASIRPHNLVSINAEFPGRITNLSVKAGSSVSVGDVLMTLTNPEFEMEYERARVRLDAVQAKLARSRVSPDNRRRQANAIQALQAARERLEGSSLDVAQRAYQHDVARVRDLQNLLQQQLATEAELEQARKNEEAGLRNLQAEKEHQSRLKEELEAAQARVEESEDLSDPSEVRHLDLLAELHQAETELRIASRHLESQQIRATAAGTILRTMVTAGDEIPSGIPLLQVAQLDRLDFDVPVGADLARRIKVGQKVNLRIPTEPPIRITAPVSEILLVPSQDQSAYTVRITTQNPAPSTVVAGLAAEVEFSHMEGSWRAALRF